MSTSRPAGILRFDLPPDPGRDACQLADIALPVEVFDTLTSMWDSVFAPRLSSAGAALGLLPLTTATEGFAEDDRAIHYVVVDDTPFPPGSLQPLPTHLTLASKQGVHLESLEHHLRTSVSTLFCPLPPEGFVQWLSAFLQDPARCGASPLQNLAISFYIVKSYDAVLVKDEIDLLLGEIMISPVCKIQSLCVRFEVESSIQSARLLLYFLANILSLDLIRRCLWLDIHFPTESRNDHRFAGFDYASFNWSHYDDDFSAEFRQSFSSSEYVHVFPEEFRCGSVADSPELLEYVCGAIKLESCRIRRLDIRDSLLLNANFTSSMMQRLLDCVASSTSIQDLGIGIGSPHLSAEENKSRCDVFSEAFLSGRVSFSRIKVLRTEIHTEEAAASVARVLNVVKVSFLEVGIFWMAAFIFSSASGGLFSLVRGGEAQLHIKCLRVQCLYKASEEFHTAFLSDLSSFVSWDKCPLLYLHCQFRGFRECPVILKDEEMELRLANALERNFLLTTFTFPWQSSAAESRAAAFLARNRLYKYGDISSQQRVKPQVARLFLCGHGEVGKTTLRKALIQLNASRQHFASSSCRELMLCKRAEPRTRGLELHQLQFSQAQKLVIYDLAGQPDYHVFHHFFISNTCNDLFIVVCKFSPSTPSATQCASQLDYWLRFINSHRNTMRGPHPKVVIVVNFLDHIKCGRISQQKYDMQHITAQHITQDFQRRYSEVLDFGTDGSNVFGINVVRRKQVKPLLQRLENLAVDLLEERPKILELSHEISSHILPPLIHKAQAMHGWMKPMLCICGDDHNEVNMVSFTELVEQCLPYQSARKGDDVPVGVARLLHEKAVLAALGELHDMAEVVFFPLDDDNTGGNKSEAQLPPADQPRTAHQSSVMSQSMNIIITNPGWFCNKVIGDLLEPQEWKSGDHCPTTKLDIMLMIKQKYGVRESADKIFAYMQRVDLFYITTDVDDALGEDQSRIQVFVPAVSVNKTVDWPPIFSELQQAGGSGASTNQIQFFGRRLKCNDTEKQLIPSGVFARLQVKLHEFCGKSAALSYKAGYHWASFVKDGVGVMIRFGGNPYVADARHVDSRAPTTSDRKMEINDDHPEWIDMLICYKSEDANQEIQELVGKPSEVSKADNIVDGIKRLIFEICQATSRSIPTVVLEEWVLRNKDDAHRDVISLADLNQIIATKGLQHSIMSWTDGQDSPVVELLLPGELHYYVASQIAAMQQIKSEFGAVTDESDQLIRIRQDLEVEGDERLSGEFKLLYDLLSKKLGGRLEELLMLVQNMRRDIQKMSRAMQKMEMNIVANCSTRMLTGVLVEARDIPVYPYICDIEQGKFAKLKSILLYKTARLHFLCESPRSCPHKVEGHVGVEVAVERGVFIRAAPVLVPALQVMCCAGRFAANAVLPGIAPAFFAPLQDMLQSLGISAQDLQTQIMSKALNALFEGVEGKAEALRQKSVLELPTIGEEEREAVKQLLKGIKDLDMHKDFGLCLVQWPAAAAGRSSADHRVTRWVCDAHATGCQIIHRNNPFAA